MTAYDCNSVVALSTDATMRAVGDGAVILMVQSGQLYSCNETARDFIARLDGVRHWQNVMDEVAQEYDVAAEVLAQDLAELLDYLLSEGVLVVRS